MHIQVFNPHLSRLRALSPLLALLILALVVSGCAPYIAIPRSADAILAPAATVEPRQHALSILAVDFDPPLDGRSLSMGEVALLVSVRNEGLSEEHDVAITARLLDPASPGGQSEIYSDTVYAGVLRPGELRVVRFTPAGGVPAMLGQYQLTVELQPAPDRVYAGDSRTYDIVMRIGD